MSLQQLGQSRFNARTPSARSRLSSLVAGLNDPGETDPFGTATYQATVGSLTDAVRSDAQDDAGRASAQGFTAGQALASGAGARSTALANGVRGAAANSEQMIAGQQSRRQALLMQALGLQVQLEEAEKARKAAQQGQLFGLLGTLGGAGIAAAFPPAAPLVAGAA